MVHKAEEKARKPPPNSRNPHPFEAPEDVVPEAFVLQEWASRFNSDAFGGFVLQWMANPEDMRKMLSHSGAVRSRLGDPCHDHCPHELVSYFDPTTRIYSVALSRLAPQLEPQGWNQEARGDICETSWASTTWSNEAANAAP